VLREAVSQTKYCRLLKFLAPPKFLGWIGAQSRELCIYLQVLSQEATIETQIETYTKNQTREKYIQNKKTRYTSISKTQIMVGKQWVKVKQAHR